MTISCKNWPIKTIFICLSFISVPKMAAAKNVKRMAVTGTAIRFIYREFEGEPAILCKHHLVGSSPYDWTVKCYHGDTPFAEYAAHIALSQYPGDTRYSIELLYWLTGTDLPSEVGSTTWFHFRTKSELLGISTSQTIAHGTAGLYLEIDAGGVRKALR